MEEELFFEFSKHALTQMGLRGISEEMVRMVLTNPDQIKLEDDRKVYQSIIDGCISNCRSRNHSPWANLTPSENCKQHDSCAPLRMERGNDELPHSTRLDGVR